MLLLQTSVAISAATRSIKTYEIKQKRNKVSVQLSPMALVVTQGKKPPTSYLYQTLTSWSTTDKGFEVTPSSGESIEFTCTEDEAEEICGGMTEKAMGLAKAAKQQKKAEKVAAEESAAEAKPDEGVDGGPEEKQDMETEEDAESIVGSKYRVIKKSVIRADFDKTSDQVGSLKAEDVIEVLEARKNDDDVMRVRFEQGWTSLNNREGAEMW